MYIASMQYQAVTACKFKIRNWSRIKKACSSSMAVKLQHIKANQRPSSVEMQKCISRIVSMFRHCLRSPCQIHILGISRTTKCEGVNSNPIGFRGSTSNLSFPSGGRIMKFWTKLDKTKNNSARAKTSPKHDRRPVKQWKSYH